MARYKAPAENIINTSIGEIKNGGGRTGARIVGKWRCWKNCRGSAPFDNLAAALRTAERLQSAQPDEFLVRFTKTCKMVIIEGENIKL